MARVIKVSYVCDWCSNEVEQVKTYFVSSGSRQSGGRSREIDICESCDPESMAFLMGKGRKPDEPEVSANGKPSIPCPFCNKPAIGMVGLAQHVGRSHTEVDVVERKAAIAKVKAEILQRAEFTAG